MKTCQKMWDKYSKEARVFSSQRHKHPHYTLLWLRLASLAYPDLDWESLNQVKMVYAVQSSLETARNVNTRRSL